MRVVDYIKENRGQLNLEEFLAILNQQDADINAQDMNGNTALHLLTTGGGTFKYVQPLLKKGAIVTTANKAGQLAFDIIKPMAENQPLLTFLLLAASINQNLLPEISTPKLALFDNSQDQNNRCKQIFTKLSKNYFDFSALGWGEILFLNQLKIKTDSIETSCNSSDKEKLYNDIGLTNPQANAAFYQFLRSFAGMITAEFRRQTEQEKVCENVIHPIQNMLNNLSPHNEINIPQDILGMIDGHLGDDLIPARLSLKEAFPPQSTMIPQGAQTLSSAQQKVGAKPR